MDIYFSEKKARREVASGIQTKIFVRFEPVQKRQMVQH